MAEISQKNKDEVKTSTRSKVFYSILNFSVVLLIAIVTLRVVNFYFDNKSSSELLQNISCSDAPKYWGVCLWNYNPNGNLRSMDRVFDRLGYVSVNASEGDEWDFLWSIEFPYLVDRLSIFTPLFNNLKPHQLINHFPGFNYISDKAFMTTRNRNVKYILPGFRFPRQIEEFKDYVKANPTAKFVEKGLRNRGIRLVENHEINYDNQKKFYQRFMEKPYLVEGLFMDFAVYVLVTSVDPLRIYRFNEVHLRFCPKPYYPFDMNDVDKYVISESLIYLLDIPEMKHYHERFGFSITQAIEDHFQKRGHNVTELWRKIDEAITQLVLNNEKNILTETLKTYNSTRHFFEITRFDFLLNEDLEPHITEVNISPVMTPIDERAEKMLSTYEQLTYDIIRLVGGGSKTELMSMYDALASNMISNSKNIAVNTEVCVDHDCAKNCSKVECELCAPCLSRADVNGVHRAFREHVRRGGFKRIFPSKPHYNEELISQLTSRNRISTKWFQAKCKENDDWC